MIHCKRCNTRPASICATCQSDLVEHYEAEIAKLHTVTREMVQAADSMAFTNGVTGQLLSATEAARAALDN